MTSDGKPYAPIRLKQIIKENFYLTKHLNNSYSDLIDITPLERKYLLEFLIDDFKKQKEVRDAFMASREENKRMR